MLAPRMAAVPARHAQVLSSKFISYKVFARGKENAAPCKLRTERAQHSLGCLIRNRICGIWPIGPGMGRIIQRLVLP